MGRFSKRLKEKETAETVKTRPKHRKGDKTKKATEIGEDRGSNPKVSLREDEMGITEFLHNRPGFAGVLKSRFSDFQVNEIDLSGNVLHLDDLSAPQLPQAQKHSEEEIAKVHKTVEGFVTAEQWQRIEELSLMSAKLKDFPKIVIDVTALEKDQRTDIHKAIKSLYEGNLVSCTAKPEDTSNKDVEKVINVMKRVGRTEDRWNHPGVFVHFLVYKENIDTAEAASKLADFLSLRNNQINYAGNKDRRAITVQKMCVKRREPSHILQAAKGQRGIHVGNFQFADTALKLGDLSGNRFRIALRHITAKQEDIVASLEHVRDNGFIHYYGLQRFGNNTEVPTHKVGVALLQGDYKAACELILKPRESDLPYMYPIRKYWWKTRDAAGAASQFHTSNKSVEKKLLLGLAAHHSNDYVSALKHIPRNLLMLYPHALQSLIFNRIASRRIKEFGLELMPGDLVFREEPNNNPAEGTEKSEKVELIDDPVDEALVEESIFKRKVKILTQEDIDSKAYTINDVVLPLPGFDITYPANVVGEWYEESLKSFELTSEKMKSSVKEIALGGSYRKLLMKPGDMKWEFRSFADKDATLILSDFDKIQGRELPANDGDLKALILEFSLPTSGYATMLLREVLKMDTSAANQIDLEAEQLKKCNWKEPAGKGKDKAKESRAAKRKLYSGMETDKDEGQEGAKKPNLNPTEECAEEKVKDSEMAENDNKNLKIDAEGEAQDSEMIEIDKNLKIGAEKEPKDSKMAENDDKNLKIDAKEEAKDSDTADNDDKNLKIDAEEEAKDSEMAENGNKNLKIDAEEQAKESELAEEAQDPETTENGAAVSEKEKELSKIADVLEVDENTKAEAKNEAIADLKLEEEKSEREVELAADEETQEAIKSEEGKTEDEKTVEFSDAEGKRTVDKDDENGAEEAELSKEAAGDKICA